MTATYRWREFAAEVPVLPAHIALALGQVGGRVCFAAATLVAVGESKT